MGRQGNDQHNGSPAWILRCTSYALITKHLLLGSELSHHRALDFFSCVW